MKMHPSISYDKISNAVRREMFGTDNPGFCIECGHEQDGCEPDAREYSCELCGENSVYGAAELLLECDLY